MQDKTINSALLNLRKQIIRGNLDGLDHVEALLSLRAVPMPRVMPAKRPDAARRDHMRRLILDALRSGPKPYRDIVARVSEGRPEITYEAAYQRTGQVLWKMRKAGQVRRDGRVWRNP